MLGWLSRPAACASRLNRARPSCITELASGVLRGTNLANAADRLYAVTLEAWRHREAFARWKARARRQRRGTTRRKVRSYAAAALP